MNYMVNPDFVLRSGDEVRFNEKYLQRPVGAAFGVSLEEMQMFVIDPKHKDLEFRLELIPDTDLMWVWVNSEELREAKKDSASVENKKSMRSFVKMLPWMTPIFLIASALLSLVVAGRVVVTGWFFPGLGAVGFWPAFGIMMGLCVFAILVTYAWAFLNHGKVD